MTEASRALPGSPWIDIGANLGHESFRSDLEAVLDRAHAAGVGACVLTGTSEEESDGAAALAAGRANLWSTAGVHPHNARDWSPETAAAFRELAGRPEVVALGECGLDFNRNFSPPDDQERALHEQLELAAELQLPVFLHERDAHERFHAILREHRARLSRAVVHCFTGTREQLERYLELDLHVGITGWICDERRGRHLMDAVPVVPADRLMVETDCPYLLPRDLRPRPKHRRNEPAHLGHVAARVAACRGTPIEQFAAETHATSCAFFAIEPDPSQPVGRLA